MCSAMRRRTAVCGTRRMPAGGRPRCRGCAAAGARTAARGRRRRLQHILHRDASGSCRCRSRRRPRVRARRAGAARRDSTAAAAAAGAGAAAGAATEPRGAQRRRRRGAAAPRRPPRCAPASSPGTISSCSLLEDLAQHPGCRGRPPPRSPCRSRSRSAVRSRPPRSPTCFSQRRICERVPSVCSAGARTSTLSLMGRLTGSPAAAGSW